MHNNIIHALCKYNSCEILQTAEGSSIEHLTEAFVTGLQSDYASTVSNIMR